MSLLRIISGNRLISYSKLLNSTSFITSRVQSTETPHESPEGTKGTGAFADAFNKFEDIVEKKPLTEQPQTFQSLLRQSKFMDMGDPEGKVVSGKIIHVIEDDLYIDFGWKFHCVCPRPKKHPSEYVRGARVRLLVKDLELSSKFLGFEKDLTLLEADCVLLGLLQDKNRNIDNIKP